MDESTDAANPAGQWIRNNLVTLGSAAVFTVYSAGYFRTREAAQRFAGESIQRRAAVAAPLTKANADAPHTEAATADRSSLPVMRLSSTAKAAGEHKGSDAPSNSTHGAIAATRASAAPATRPTSAGPQPADTAAPLAAPSPTPAPPVIPSVATPAAIVTPPPSTAAAAPTADSSAAPADRTEESTQLRDGVFSGWGTSRHGDIQASVEIRNGRIVGAYISQCLTQYSCSWVSALPPEVVQRQSAEVDYVSGATQSSNAFYYAVAQALKKAK